MLINVIRSLTRSELRGMRSLCIFKVRMIRIRLSILFIVALMILQGCGTLSNGRSWGQDATLSPGWDRIEESVISAAMSPETWGPVVAALVLQVDDMDKNISDWASRNTPVFGSQKDAGQWSDYLAYSSGAAYLTTALAAPSGEVSSNWSISKLKGLTVGATAWGISSCTTALLKHETGRTRPDGSNKKSLPSDHGSASAVFATLARRNLQSLSLSPGSKMLADLGISGIAVGTGWARIEAKRHYPSDVLVGYAIGHFFSAFINDAFLGLDKEKAPILTMEPSRKSITVNLKWAY